MLNPLNNVQHWFKFVLNSNNFIDGLPFLNVDRNICINGLKMQSVFNSFHRLDLLYIYKRGKVPTCYTNCCDVFV